MSAPIFLGTDVGNIGGGALVRYLVGRNWSVRRARGVTVGLSSAFLVPAVTVGYQNDAYIAIGLLIVAATAIASITTNYLAALQEISFASVGLIAGILGAFGNMVGATVNPLIGRYVDTTGHYQLVFLLLGVLPLVGLVALLSFDAVVARGTGPLNGSNCLRELGPIVSRKHPLMTIVQSHIARLFASPLAAALVLLGLWPNADVLAAESPMHIRRQGNCRFPLALRWLRDDLRLRGVLALRVARLAE